MNKNKVIERILDINNIYDKKWLNELDELSLNKNIN